MADTYDYSRSKAQADRMIAKFGKAGTILKAGSETATGGDPWDPPSQTGGTPTEIACTLVDFNQLFMERAGSLIETTSRQVLIARAGLTDATAPQRGDQLRIGSVTLPIQEVAPFSPGETVTHYDVKVGR